MIATRTRTTRRRAIVYALLVALCLLLLGAANTPPLRQFREAVDFALSPVQGALVRATRSVTSVFATIAEIEQLRQENHALQSQVQELQAQIQQLESVRVQNEQLTELLAVRSSLDYETVAAEVIGREVSQSERTIFLDRGTDVGVSIGDPVLAGGGALIGSVIDAGPNYSMALLLSDTRSVVIGLIESSRATGEVHGRIQGILAMTNIPATDLVAVGDRVVTAGLDLGNDIRSPYPRGLLIGRVVDVQSDVAAIVQSAFIEPAASLDKLEYVLVITDFEPVVLPEPGASPSPGASPDVSPTGVPEAPTEP